MGVRSRRAAVIALALAVVATVAACDLTDSDGDGVADTFETQHGWDPADPDEDGDGELDGHQDSDVDGLTDWMEDGLGSDPDDPNDPDPGIDSDRDSLTDWAEGMAGTQPGTPDSDGDFSLDYEELLAATDPNDPVAHPEGFGDPPCDPAAATCPDVDLFVMWTTLVQRDDHCPAPFCQPEQTLSALTTERQRWRVTAEVGDFHANLDGSGFWPLESATVTGQGRQVATESWTDQCRSFRADTTWSETRPTPPPGPDVPFLTLSAGGSVQVRFTALWGTEVLRRDKTTSFCGASSSTSTWQPWAPANGPCGASAFLQPSGVGYPGCFQEVNDTSTPLRFTQSLYVVSGTFRPPS